MAVTLTVTFDGACVFFHHDLGVDVWVPADPNHTPVLRGKGRWSSGAHDLDFPLGGWTMHLVHGLARVPVPTGKVNRATASLVPYLDKLVDVPLAYGLPDYVTGQLPCCLSTQLRFGEGALDAQAPGKNPSYATSVWTLPGGGKQQLTSVSTYSATELKAPIRVILTRGRDEQWFEPAITNGAAKFEIEMRDWKMSKPITEDASTQLATLQEFRILLGCFDKAECELPVTAIVAPPPPDPKKTVGGPISSTDPLCPQGQVPAP